MSLGHFERVKQNGITLTTKKIQRAHAAGVEQQVIDADNLKYAQNITDVEGTADIGPDAVPESMYDHIAQGLIGPNQSLAQYFLK